MPISAVAWPIQLTVIASSSLSTALSGTRTCTGAGRAATHAETTGTNAAAQMRCIRRAWHARSSPLLANSGLGGQLRVDQAAAARQLGEPGRRRAQRIPPQIQ